MLLFLLCFICLFVCDISFSLFEWASLISKNSLVQISEKFSFFRFLK